VWWKELDGSKPVILVTQGTVANTDLNELIGPTLVGLSTEDVTVIAATGKPDGEIATPVPENAIVTPFIPFLEVLPKVDVFVTNCGYGAVNQALSMGVPLVVAGETEDKAFVAARVAWTGAGINLGTSRPTPEQMCRAVRQVLNEDTYRAKARTLRNNYAQYDALNLVNSYVESFLESERIIRAAYEHSNA
jgi:UDP:flavonoid glycosyltransferase YjiC (YdhE family)